MNSERVSPRPGADGTRAKELNSDIVQGSADSPAAVRNSDLANDQFYTELTSVGHPIWAATQHRFVESWQTLTVDGNDDRLANHAFGRGSHVCAVMGPGAYMVFDIDRHGDDPAKWGDVGAVAEALEAAGVTIAARVATGGGGWHLYVPASPEHAIDTAEGALPDFPGVELKGRGSVFLPGTQRGKHEHAPYRLEWSRLAEVFADVDGFMDSQDALTVWLDEHLAAPASPERKPDADVRLPVHPSEIAHVKRQVAPAVEQEVRLVAEAELGRRDRELVGRVFKLGRYAYLEDVNDGEVISREGVRQLMKAACEKNGLLHPTRPDSITEAQFNSKFDRQWERGDTLGRREVPFDRAEDVFAVEGTSGAPAGGAGAEEEPAASEEDRQALVREQFPRLDLAALLDPNRPRREWVVSGLVPAGASVAFVAKAGSMKSLLLLALSLTVARGDSQFAGLAIPRQRRVLYVDMENTEDDLEERIRDLGVQPQDMDELVYLHLPTLGALDAAEGGQRVADICDAYGLQKGDMVVLDSFQRVVEGPENDSDTYRDFYKHTGFLLKKRGLTVLRTDNTGKDETKGARGSSSKRDDVDIELNITRSKQDPDNLLIAPGKLRISGVEPVSVAKVMDEDDRLTFTTLGDPIRDAVMAAWRELDRLGLPADASGRKCIQAMEDAGSAIPRDRVRQAAKERAASAPRTPRAPTNGGAP